MSVGRDDLCPCGSGKKYKYCCMKIGSSGLRLVEPADSAKEEPRILKDYRDFCEARMKFGGSVPSFNEFLGRPEIASDLFDELKEGVEAAGICSKEELDELFDEYSSAEDNTPRAVFLGLSSHQIYSLLDSTLDDEESIVHLNEDISDEDIADTPVMKRVLVFLQMLSERGDEAALTGTGCLKLSFCREYMSRVNPEFGNEEFSFRSEADFPFLGLLRVMLCESGCLKSSKTRIRMTYPGRTLLEGKNLTELYKEFFSFYLYGFNWSDLSQEILSDISSLYQNAVEFSLYILKDRIRRGITLREISDIFHRAFLDEEDHEEEEIHLLMESAYYHLVVESFFQFFGILGGPLYLETLDKRMESSEKLEITPLFKKLFIWKIK